MTKKSGNLKLQKSKAHRYRFTVGRFLQLAVALVFLIFVGRFLYLGISKTVNGRDLSQRTEQLYKRNQVIKSTRGSIYDRAGLVIAEDYHVYTIYAILDKSSIDYKNKPEYVVNKEKTAYKLAKVLPMSTDKILKCLSPSKDTFQVQFGAAGSNLSKEQKDKISAMKLPGIKFIEAPARLYPNGNFASHVVGLAQPKLNKKTGSESLVGTMGLEAFYDNYLSGKDGYQTSSVDASNYKTPNSTQDYKPSHNGDNLYLTLDSQLQNLLESRLSNVQKKYLPVKATAVVEDIKTGKVLAASQRPTFNPQTKKGLANSYRDVLVQDTYEPGSVFKILTLAASVDSGHYQPNQYYNSGTVRVNGSTIHDWIKSGWGSIPFWQAFARSSNTGFVHIEQQMGSKTWRKYLKRFHIGEKTGVTLPGEQAGLISFKLPIDQVVTSFGQGVNVNAMQMMQAFSSLANNGQMVKPQFVERITDANDKTVKNYHVQKVGKPVYTAKTRKVILTNMKRVLNKRIGTGYAYKIKGKSIAVKTGTAQIANPTGGGYLTGNSNYVFSVVGVTPAKKPRYCIYLTIQQPRQMSQSAETILDSIFKPLMNRVIIMSKNVPKKSTKVVVPKLTSMNKALNIKKKFQLVKIGSGSKITRQLPQSGKKQKIGSKIFVLVPGEITCPNMKKWSRQDLDNFMNLSGIRINITGKGVVDSQSIVPGTKLKSNTKLKVVLKE